MILSVERAYLEDVAISLKEKLKYIEKGSYIADKVIQAQKYVDMAVSEMKKYENHINFVESSKDPTRNIVAKY